MSEADPQTIYEERCYHFLNLKIRFQSESKRLALYRLSAFFCAMGMLLFWYLSNEVIALWPLLALAFLGLFANFITRHKKVLKKLDFASEMWEINDEGLLRLDRKWKALPEVPMPEYDDLNLSKDLDLFGHASLFQLLCRANTP
ncbi:MAG: hypothetical protein HQL32_16295, partial [Planctomycetes bacterium]|nr:hypothetical protein [Planctomycetota bacterium]